ncbi:hypothetical protein HDU93_007432 [Gonapodya sp. JEL0774]|nr:hypothetical protein HDU93_007432 [Gonapodya sp. JEL0774]
MVGEIVGGERHSGPEGGPGEDGKVHACEKEVEEEEDKVAVVGVAHAVGEPGALGRFVGSGGEKRWRG